jgi:hypothetical protein
MTDENVTREALREAVGRTCVHATYLRQATLSWLDGDWQGCAQWLLADAAPVGAGLRCSVSMAAALLRIAYSAPGMREAWLAGLPAADAAAVRAEMEGEG